MKGKKYKRSQHYVKNVYEKYFGIRKPYQIIVDAPFCIETLKIKIAPSEALTEVFGGTVKLMTTPCIQAELTAHDRQNDSGAAFVARRFEIRRCQHDKGSKTGSECIKDLISTHNPHHYCIAGQDLELRKDLRQIAGVPLVFILRDTVVMEAPTEKCLKRIKRLEEKKLKSVDLAAVKKATEKAVSVAVAVSSETLENGPQEISGSTKQKPKSKKKKKRIGPKPPNPLSCKKPKKDSQTQQLQIQQQQQQQSSLVKPTKKPRKRRPKKNKKTKTEAHHE